MFPVAAWAPVPRAQQQQQQLQQGKSTDNLCCCMAVPVYQVAAVERMLTDIDELPEQFKSAEIVYLSNNCLTHLQVSAALAHCCATNAHSASQPSSQQR
jgi:hypothetical protein